MNPTTKNSLILEAPLWRLLFIAAMSLAGAGGCANTDPGTSEDSPEGTADKVRSALSVTVYDFIANAPGATWSNNDGGVNWGKDGDKGTDKTDHGYLEDGVNHSLYLATRPKPVANGFIHGSYFVTVPGASLHPSITATFGFVQGATGTDGLTFSISTPVNGNPIALLSQRKTYTGTLSTVTVDLSAYAGQTIELILSVYAGDADAGATYTQDQGAWTDLRMVADSVPPPVPGSCTINGASIVPGAVNPAVPCQICDATVTTSAWTTKADSCLIGGTCYLGDAKDSLGCKKCDPLVSQTSWTAQAACDNLVLGSTNSLSSTAGDWAKTLGPGRSYPDSLCAADGASQGLPGTWKAMFSDPNIGDLKDIVPSQHQSKPVVNLHGEQMYPSWTSIFTNQQWASGFSLYRFSNSAETGNLWTGTDATGVWNTTGINGGNCQTWTSTSYSGGFAKGRVADASVRKLLDGVTGGKTCSTSQRFACVLVPPGGQGGPPPPPNPPPAPTSALRVTVQNYDGTAEGTLEGVAQGNAVAWKAVPYAAPPTGSLRLAPPAKVTSWSGVRPAYTMPSACAQSPFFPTGGYIGSEDCLYLNIWAPKTATSTSNLPVIVYHHPGGLMYGSSSAVDDWVGYGLFDGHRFAAAQNVIIVTIQTRLAALGYLASAELSANATSQTSTAGGGTSGNYGLLDGIQSLKWLKRNIAAFGGDPTRISFGGQSGGASFAGMLLASPLAKDPADNKPYFSSVYLMSGFYEEPSMSYRYTQATASMSTLGCSTAPDKVACLRSAPLQNFVDAAGDFLYFIPAILNGPVPPEVGFGLKFGPNVDGYVLPAQPRVTIAAGQHHKVPVILGSTEKEWSSFMVTAVAGAVRALSTGDINSMVYLPTCQAYYDRATLNLGATIASAAIALYPCSPLPFIGPTTSYQAPLTHAQYECPARRMARALVAGPSPAPVRRYWFTHNADHIGVFQNLLGLVPQIGAAHMLDAPYLFNNHSAVMFYWPSQRELELTTRYQSYWKNFAASPTGDPNSAGMCPGNNCWTAYDRNQDNALSLKVVGETGPSDPGPQMVSGIDTTLCDFWDDNYNLDGYK